MTSRVVSMGDYNTEAAVKAAVQAERERISDKIFDAYLKAINTSGKRPGLETILEIVRDAE